MPLKPLSNKKHLMTRMPLEQITIIFQVSMIITAVGPCWIDSKWINIWVLLIEHIDFSKKHNTLIHISFSWQFHENGPWNTVTWRNGCCVCGANALSVSHFACVMIDHSGFTNQHSKCTWSTVFHFPLFHLSIGCAWSEIWCATRHAWLWVLSQGICVIVMHATLQTLITICVLCWQPWSGLSPQCTKRWDTLLHMLIMIMKMALRLIQLQTGSSILCLFDWLNVWWTTKLTDKTRSHQKHIQRMGSASAPLVQGSPGHHKNMKSLQTANITNCGDWEHRWVQKTEIWLTQQRKWINKAEIPKKNQGRKTGQKETRQRAQRNTT